MTELDKTGNDGYKLNWDSEINDEARSIILLEEGDYDFTVTNVEKSQYQSGPNSKIPNCPMAKLDLTIANEKGEEVVLQHRLYLFSTQMGLLSAFFESIGVKKPQEPLHLTWNIIGKTGSCHVNTRIWNGNTYNNVNRFYTKNNTVQAPGYTPGKF